MRYLNRTYRVLPTWPLPDVADAAEYGLDELNSESRWSLERAPHPPNIDPAFEPERNG